MRHTDFVTWSWRLKRCCACTTLILSYDDDDDDDDDDDADDDDGDDDTRPTCKFLSMPLPTLTSSSN